MPVGVLNLDDVPEILPGAQPGASSAARRRFEARSVELNQVERQEREAAFETRVQDEATTLIEVERMFPILDVELVRALYSEASSPEVGMNTLLALAAAMNEPSESLVLTPSVDIGVEDELKFPSLTDAEGWQVVGHMQFDHDQTHDLGDEWAKRTKAAAALPQLAPARPRQSTWRQPEKATRRLVATKDSGVAELPVDYDERDLRCDEYAKWRRQQRRQQRRAHNGRGHGRPSHKPQDSNGGSPHESEKEGE